MSLVLASLRRTALVLGSVLALSAQAQSLGDPAGWTGLGNTSVSGGQLGLSSGDGAVDIALIGQATGLAVTQFDTVDSVAYQGSLLQRSFTGSAGQRVDFSWQFSSTETSGDPSFADYAFVVLDGQFIRLGGVGSAPLAGTPTQLVLGGSGTHTVSFGVVDLGDYTTPSSLQVSGLAVSAVPEPGRLALMLAGLAMLGWRARRQQG